mmetsp:Transcript_27039/g.72770  ORF Transcript_27039/g.72770 Transcript_27039/m.72770 type:complete len:80 (-) Transcript_27039:125-364(-)
MARRPRCTPQIMTRDDDADETAGAALRKFTITKLGPAEGEVTTEVRELTDDGTLRATFSHTKPGEPGTTTVVRVYTRAK